MKKKIIKNFSSLRSVQLVRKSYSKQRFSGGEVDKIKGKGVVGVHNFHVPPDLSRRNRKNQSKASPLNPLFLEA